MRLDKYLAETAQCPPGEAKDPAEQGTGDGERRGVQKGDTQLREGDSVAVDGAPLAYQQFVYLMLQQA